jgi:hypothetical protein
VGLSASVSSLPLPCGWLPENNGKEPCSPKLQILMRTPAFHLRPCVFLELTLQRALTARSELKERMATWRSA